MLLDKKASQRNVYVVLLDPNAAKDSRILRQNPGRDPAKPCVYVGMTGLSVAERYENHKRGHKCSVFVKRYGSRLIPELFEHLNPMSHDAAVKMERDLAEALRRAGYTVTGGH